MKTLREISSDLSKAEMQIRQFENELSALIQSPTESVLDIGFKIGLIYHLVAEAGDTIKNCRYNVIANYKEDAESSQEVNEKDMDLYEQTTLKNTQNDDS